MAVAAVTTADTIAKGGNGVRRRVQKFFYYMMQESR